MKNIVIIPIGGIGVRMKNNNPPKQFIEINGKPIYMYVLEKFEKNSKIDKIIIACLKGYEEDVKKQCMKKGIKKLTDVVTGGKTQLESIYNCLNKIKSTTKKEDNIIVHVGNRPNLSDDLINRIIKESSTKQAIVPVIPEIEVMANKKTKKIIPRKDVVRIQTPQLYKYEQLLFFVENGEKYYEKYATICDMLIENDKDVDFVDGELLNFKITYNEDLELFKKLMSN